MQRENPDGNPYNNGFEYGVRHLLSPRSGLVSDILLSSLELAPNRFSELLELGSIYVSGKRLLADVWVEGETYIRLHTKPRRFPKNDFQWGPRLIFQNEDFVVVNKPAALPVHASVDNRLENLQCYLSEYLGQELFVTHRLDVPTRGLLVFAKTKSFLSEFNRLLTERAVQKIYRARACGLPLAPGVYEHFMEPSPRAPKTLSLTAFPGWQECRLEILSVKGFGAEAGVGASAPLVHQELRIELLTGRTHQIRSQLAALGAPICGDVMYGAAKKFTGEEIDLTAESLRFLTHHFVLESDEAPDT
jgi:23S rRNA pseudouridine1911/1915/1917 synthase